MKKTFEQAMERLEEIADLLQNGEKGLDESLTLYEEGNELAKFCEAQLTKAESRLQILSRKDGELNLETTE